jgi:hypothetical protein
VVLRRGIALPVALAVALGVSAACSGHGDSADLKPHPLPGSATSVVDYSGVSLPRVPGTTTTSSVTEQGTASIDGTVSGPGGLIPGASVLAEHLVGRQAIPHLGQTGADGHFVIQGIPGGAYRVRAFLPPSLAQTTPDVRFIDDGKATTYQLSMEDQRKVVARAAVAPSSPFVGDDVTLAVVVANRTVDQSGVVQSVPLPGLQVELSGLGAYQLAETRRPPSTRGTTTTTAFSFTSPTNAFTDAQGQATFDLRCASAGNPTLELLVTVTVTPAPVQGQPPPVPTQQVQHLPLEVPSCLDPSSATVSPSDGTTDGTVDTGGVADTGGLAR